MDQKGSDFFPVVSTHRLSFHMALVCMALLHLGWYRPYHDWHLLLPTSTTKLLRFDQDGDSEANRLHWRLPLNLWVGPLNDWSAVWRLSIPVDFFSRSRSSTCWNLPPHYILLLGDLRCCLSNLPLGLKGCSKNFGSHLGDNLHFRSKLLFRSHVGI